LRTQGVSNGELQRRKGAKVIVVASVCVATLTSSGLAHAQGQSADTLFEEGLKLFDAGKTHEACERFEASFRIDPALGTLQNLATCHEQDGKTATAYREFLDLAEQAKKAGAGQKAREILGRQRAEALTSKLSKVVIQAKPGANVVEVRLDGTLVDLAAWGVAFPVDPGRHTFVFSAPGRVASTQEINLAAAPGVTTVELPHLEDVPPPPPAPVASPSPLRPIGIAVGSLGLVGLVLSGVFGGLTFAKRTRRPRTARACTAIRKASACKAPHTASQRPRRRPSSSGSQRREPACSSSCGAAARRRKPAPR
jgi:hypothetical protein